MYRPTSRIRRRAAELTTLVLGAAAVAAVPTGVAHASAWLPPQTLSAEGVEVRDHAIAVDAGGRATLVWEQDGGTSNQMQMQQIAPDGTRGPIVPLALPSSGRPAVAVAADGVATATWTWYDGTQNLVQARRIAPDGALGPVRTLSNAPESADLPQIVLAANGTATVAWTSVQVGTQRVRARTLAPDGTMGPIHLLKTWPAGLIGQSIAGDAAGAATVLWREFNTSTTYYEVRTRRIAANGTLGTERAHPTVATAGSDARLAIAPSGEGIVVWSEAFPIVPTPRVLARRLAPDGTPSPTILPLSATPGYTQDPRVGVDANGVATAAWTRDGTAQARTVAIDGTLGPVHDVTAPGQNANNLNINVESDGRTTLLWGQSTDAGDVIHARQLGPDGALGPDTPLSTSGEDAGRAIAATDAAGNATALWTSDDGVIERLQSAFLDAQGPTVNALAVPAGGLVSQPLAFAVTASDNRAGIATTTWSFGDGATGSGASLAHAYASPGVRTATVTLTDGAGNVTTRSQPLTITPAPATPTPPQPTTKATAKLQIARAQVQRSSRLLDVLAPITKLASGPVRVEFAAAGRRTTFSQDVDAQRGQIKIARRISAAQARLGTGIVTLSYRGDADTRPQEVRLRAASQKANLTVLRPRIDGGRLKTSGRISARARGIVRVQLEYVVAGKTETVEYTARIRDGRWTLNTRLSAVVLAGIAAREGTVHSSTLFTGYFPSRIRGEMRSYQVLGPR